MTVGIDYVISTCPTLTFEELLALTNCKQTRAKMLDKTKSEKEFAQFKRKYKKQLYAIKVSINTSDEEQATLEYILYNFKKELDMLAFDQKIGSAYCGGYFDAIYFMVHALLKKKTDKEVFSTFSTIKGWNEVQALLAIIKKNYGEGLK